MKMTPRLIFVATIALAGTLIGYSLHGEGDHRSPFAHDVSGDAAISKMIKIIDAIHTDNIGISLAAGQHLVGKWSLTCGFYPPHISDSEANQRQYARAHKVVEFKGTIYVGSGGSDGGLGAGRIWTVEKDGCQDVTPWGNSADRVFSMYTNGKSLYASACKFAGYGELWRTNDGAHWNKIHTFGKEVSCILNMTEYKGSLCVALELRVKTRASLVCETDGEWRHIFNSHSRQIYSLQEFDGALYVGAAYPAELWRTSDLRVGGDWGPGVSHVETMTVFDHHLIVGFGRNPVVNPNAPTVRAFDGKQWRVLGHQPDEWLTSHNFNASTTFDGTLIISMGSMFDRMAVWALDANGEWYQIGSRMRGDWGGQKLAYRPFTGEWIYDLRQIGGNLFATFSGDPGMPALWRFHPSEKNAGPSADN